MINMDEKNPKKEELDFVYDEDLMPVLEKLGIKGDFINGKIKCLFCQKVITLDNLYSFFQDADGLKVVCNEEECIKQLKTKE